MSLLKEAEQDLKIRTRERNEFNWQLGVMTEARDSLGRALLESQEGRDTLRAERNQARRELATLQQDFEKVADALQEAHDEAIEAMEIAEL